MLAAKEPRQPTAASDLLLSLGSTSLVSVLVQVRGRRGSWRTALADDRLAAAAVELLHCTFGMRPMMLRSLEPYVVAGRVAEPTTVCRRMDTTNQPASLSPHADLITTALTTPDEQQVQRHLLEHVP
jgi:hypothetical protein